MQLAVFLRAAFCCLKLPMAIRVYSRFRQKVLYFNQILRILSTKFPPVATVVACFYRCPLLRGKTNPRRSSIGSDGNGAGLGSGARFGKRVRLKRRGLREKARSGAESAAL